MKTILVVDDFATLRAAIHLPLKQAGYQVVEAADGQEALEQLQKTEYKFDLIITDINMPRLSGIELIKGARNIERYQHVPIITVTTQTGEDILLKAGATAYLQKPFEAARLLAIVKKLIR